MNLMMECTFPSVPYHSLLSVPYELARPTVGHSTMIVTFLIEKRNPDGNGLYFPQRPYSTRSNVAFKIPRFSKYNVGSVRNYISLVRVLLKDFLIFGEYFFWCRIYS